MAFEIAQHIGKVYRWTDRQTDGQTDRHTDTGTDGADHYPVTVVGV